MIEWLYSGQAKLTIPQCEDAMLLAKQCKLEQLKEEIQQAVNKANSFGNHCYLIFQIQNFSFYASKRFLFIPLVN